MDKYEYKVSSDEIKSLIGQGNYAQAAEIADTIDWRRVKSVMMLCTVSDLYKINRRYEDAKNMLLLAYEKRPGGRTICYSLCELCIKTEEFMQALKYFKEFVQVAPKDTGRYILQYKLYEAQEVSLEERISVLEELKKRDYREKWAYELAYLYHRVGLATRCVEECDELILWFGDGKYVVKAMELKMLHQPLTPAQQAVYDRRFEVAEPAKEQEADDQEIYEEADYGQQSAEEQGDYDWLSEEERLEGDGQTAAYGEENDAGQQPDELDIQVKTVDVGQYNTINLQAELAAGLQEVLEADGMPYAGVVAEEETEAAAQGELPEEDGYQNFGEEEIEDSEVFFGATGELEDASLELEAEYEGGENWDESPEENRPETDWQAPEPEPVEWTEEKPIEEAEADNSGFLRTTETAGNGAFEKALAEEGETLQVAERLVENEAGDLPDVQPPREMADVLSQEANGQISIVLPENIVVEKQITGQMKLEDILAEWERIKKENEARCQEEVRRHVLNQTGPMFTEFETVVRDGLLEQLEKGETQETGGQEQTAETESALEEQAKQEEENAGAEEAAEAGADYIEPEGLEEPEEEYIELEETAESDAGYEEPEELTELEEVYEEPGEMTELEEVYMEPEEQLTELEEVYEEPGELTDLEEVYAEPEELTELEEVYVGSEELETAEGPAYDAEIGELEETDLEEESEYPEEYGYNEEPEYPEEDGNLEEIGLEDGAEYVEAGEEIEYIEETEYVEEADYTEETEEETETAYIEDSESEDDFLYEEGMGDTDEAGDMDETGYTDEAGDMDETGYTDEAGGTDEAGSEYETEYEKEISSEGEPEYIEQAAASLEENSIQEDNIVEEIEEIQEQVEEAEKKKRLNHIAGPKTPKTENNKNKHEKAPIEREQAKVRSMTREEKELFAPFIQNRRSREQLVKALDSISMAAYTGNLIITGEEGMDTLTLAQNMMREIRMTDSNFSGKVAKVSGQGLNKKDMAETLRQLKNGALIILKASGMSSKTAAMLHKQLQHERFGIIVVLEDTEKAMKKLFLGTPDLYGDFTARVDLEALSNDSLVAFGRQYAREKEFSIDNLGVLALHTRIEELQTIDHVVTVMEVKEIVDEAIRRASKKTLGHFFDVLLARRYDDEDMVILTEKDFAA